MENFNIEESIHHFGLDHLEVFWTFKDETLFDKLDFDNSNYSELDEYKITKNEVPKYKYKIIFTKGEYSLFAYYKWCPKSEKQPVWTRDYITIYSTAFKLLEYEEILWFLEWYLDLRHCRRFDICIDLKIEIDELLSNFFVSYKTGRDYRKSWKTETRYYWEMMNSKNKRQLIRVYNKITDILVKKKIALYQDYLVENNITRIELEVRPELAKVINYKEVFDNSILMRIFKNYLRKYSKIFDELDWKKISLFEAKKTKLHPEDYQSLYYRTQKKAMFVAYARTAYNLWFCPVRVLIAEWYIQDKTKYLLWVDKIEDILNKERDVRIQARENYYIKNNIDEILGNYYKYGKL